MTFDEWVKHGVKNKWCTYPVCETHDGVPMTQAEVDCWEEGDDPCIHVIRLAPTDEEHTELMDSVPVWRRT